MVHPKLPLLLSVLFLFCCISQAQDCLPNAATAPGFCAKIWTRGLSGPRGMIVLSNNDVLIVEGGTSTISLFYENRTSSGTNVVKVVLASGFNNINHGIAFGDGYLYASNANTVYRWSYTVGNRTPLGAGTPVITGIPSTSHNTRTLVYNNGSISFGLGSDGNIDSTGRVGIYRFATSSFPTTFAPANYQKLAGGIRNEVGLRFDLTGRLWGVENGVDRLDRPDLGTQIVNQNPGEEVNLFDQPGGFYGYPYCWTKYNITNVTTPFMTQYAHPDFIKDGIHTDAWCQNTSNVVLPKYSLRAHTAPLDIIFYPGPSTNATAWPVRVGDAFVTSHGSWNRQPAAGYNVLHLNFTNGLPYSDQPILAYVGPGETGNNWIRPVGLGWYKCATGDCLLVTDDSDGKILSISYGSTCSCNQPTVAPTSGTALSSITSTTSGSPGSTGSPSGSTGSPAGSTGSPAGSTGTTGTTSRTTGSSPASSGTTASSAPSSSASTDTPRVVYFTLSLFVALFLAL